ncbi:MAG: aspartate kinase [Coriobacteriaceae bacterium]|nr:MAG: aspartate kinase [Coriobacteriaceae bacterium]
MIKVAKFGGSSVADAEQFKKVKQIVQSDPARKFIVVSAAGRRNPADNKITDLLYLVCAHLQYHVDEIPLLEDVKQRFVSIAHELNLKYPIEEKFNEFENNIKNYSPEYIVSRGEYFTGQLLAEYLGLSFVDAAEVIRFHRSGTVSKTKTLHNIHELAKKTGPFLLPGFYGATPDKEIRLFDRGGGDITGSLVARAIGVDLYENWTDVSGFLSADPRIVDNPRPILRITFDEMRELSYMGASVLHEESIFPVREVGIPIVIKNTNDPFAPGTIISDDPMNASMEHLITGIAGKKNFLSVNVKKNHMSTAVGTVRKVLSIFERYGVSVEHIPTGIDSFGIVVHASDVHDCLYDIVGDIQDEVQPDEVKVVDKFALVSIVGRNISRHVGTSGRIFTALGRAGINIRLIMQNSEEISIIVGVDDSDFENAIRTIYNAFANELVEDEASDER